MIIPRNYIVRTVSGSSEILWEFHRGDHVWMAPGVGWTGEVLRLPESSRTAGSDGKDRGPRDPILWGFLFWGKHVSVHAVGYVGCY